MKSITIIGKRGHFLKIRTPSEMNKIELRDILNKLYALKTSSIHSITARNKLNTKYYIVHV